MINIYPKKNLKKVEGEFKSWSLNYGEGAFKDFGFEKIHKMPMSLNKQLSSQNENVNPKNTKSTTPEAKPSDKDSEDEKKK